jgi:parallel beta-helix repeat protein
MYMNRKRTMALVIILISMLGFSFRIQRVEASGTIYIRADGSIDPATAPISTLDNVTYILTGNITSDADGIVVERDNVVIDGADYTIQGTYAYLSRGTDVNGRSNVTIKNLNICAFSYGIQSRESFNIGISGNKITDNGYYGVELWFTSDCSISENLIGNGGCGISLSDCSNNSISRNNITDNSDFGIELSSSPSNSVSENLFVNNGLYVCWGSFGNVVSGNFVNGKPLVYLEGASDVVVDDAGQVVLVQCNRIRVENLSLSNATIGVQLWQTNNTRISQSNMTANNKYGICLDFSSYNNISRNNITDNGYGIFLYETLNNNNSICGNLIKANNRDGIILSVSLNNNISGNVITANNRDGIRLTEHCNFTSISGNNITANREYGIALSASCNNSINGNYVANNECGIRLVSAYDNHVFHNSLIDNTNQLRCDQSPNVWDDGYPSGGNYWSDYNGTDANHDGIGDTPYVIDANNADNYPLMAQYVVPEFPSFLILPLFFIATLLSVIVYRRKHAQNE